MNTSGDAAEQIVRMSLQGVEVGLRITGTAAKEIALLIMAALKSPDGKIGKLKLKGKERLAAMLKSGKAMEIYSLKESDLQKFSEAAKQYGIVYCVLRPAKNCPDGLCDVLVKADDAPKISRIIERFKFATVDKAKIESELIADRAVPAMTVSEKGVQPDAPEISDVSNLLNELLGTHEGKTKPDMPGQVKPDHTTKETSSARPLSQDRLGQHPRPSGPTSDRGRSLKRDALSKPSVKEEIREMTAARKVKEADAPKPDVQPKKDKSKDNRTITHKEPRLNKKPKTKNMKVR